MKTVADSLMFCTDENFFLIEENLNAITIVSLRHDLGKANYKRQRKNYIPNFLKSGELSKSKALYTNKDRLYIPHEIVSLIVANQFIELTEEEEFAISSQWHVCTKWQGYKRQRKAITVTFTFR